MPHLFLSDEQIADTLERHGYARNQPYLGIHYAADGVTISVQGKDRRDPATLIQVPNDLLDQVALPPEEELSGSGRLFDRPDL